MKKVSDIPELDRKGLREFGLTTGSIVAVLFGLLLPWIFDTTFPMWPWIVFSVLVVWALAVPATLRGFYRLWMRVGLLISKVTTPIIMGVVYYLLITPTGLVRRLFATNSVVLEFDDELDSYRTESQPPNKEHLEKPF